MPPRFTRRYLALAREAARTDDRVVSENYYQKHAEHYFRIKNLGQAGQSSGDAALDRSRRWRDGSRAGSTERDLAGSHPRTESVIGSLLPGQPIWAKFSSAVSGESQAPSGIAGLF